jgi:hypothetical protein
MRKIMIRRIFLLLSMTLVISATSCIKETYDMNKLSEDMHLSPTLAISAIKGDVSLSDMVKTNDTVIFDQNNLVKIVFKEDSVLELHISDFYNLDNMVAFSETYTIGELSLSPFQYITGFTLKDISDHFSAPLKATFESLDDGSAHPFPSFPSTDLGEQAYSISNFENALFTSGFIDISVTNNLTAPINSISVKIFNSAGHSPIGSEVIIPGLEPGQTHTTSINLADITVTNSILAAIVLSGSDGTGSSDPVLIDLNNSNIRVTIRGRDLVIKSGRAIIPEQTLIAFSNNDTVDFSPGNGIELDKLKIATGNLTYHFQSTCPLKVSFGVALPDVLRSDIILSESINVNPNSVTNGTISVNNTIFDMSADPDQPYNRVPMETAIVVKSDGLLVNFNSTDEIKFDLRLPNPVFDYIKGYFGQQVEAITPDSIDLDIEDILDHLSGDFLISSPKVTVNYSNSFAIPIQISLNAEGIKKAEKVSLGLAPIILSYPDAPVNRDISSAFVVDKSNSSLPELISMPPEKIRFSGSAKMNPAGSNGLRDNYVFDDSRLIGSVEVEVPLDFSINNLQYTDTVDNFMKEDNDNNDFPLQPEDFEFLRVNFSAKNGFPLGVSVEMSLYDSNTHSIKSTVDATGILEPAPVDSNGKATGETETSTTIELTREFFSSINSADKIIFKFILNTTGNGANDIKIYSDYRIEFNAAFVVKPDIKYN